MRFPAGGNAGTGRRRAFQFQSAKTAVFTLVLTPILIGGMSHPRLREVRRVFVTPASRRRFFRRHAAQNRRRDAGATTLGPQYYYII